MAVGIFCPNSVGVETVMQPICKNLTRWHQCFVLMLGVISSLNAWGLSLGHIVLESTLNQPLQASITLEKVQRLTPQDVRVGLAPKSAFDAIGVDWSSSLDDLGFVVVSSRSGLVIELSTERPIVEPYLNFVLELAWPNGRLVREYTVLLDPPVLLAPVRSEAIAPMPSRRDIASTRARQDPPRGSDADRMTQSGDTLWEIALTARPDRGTSVQAMMLAIQSRNPSAFMNQNINRLKAGYVLVMPDQEDLDRITFESALAEVASQNSEQLVPASPKKNPPPEPSADSELVLVAVDVDAAEDLSAASAEVLAATDVAQGLDENLNTRAAIERDVLAGRLASLESKLESLASTISLKDQQILALQKQLKTLEALPKPVPESSFLTPMSVAFMVALVVLVVVLLLMSARYQRLTRSLRAATASPVASELQVSSPAPMVAEASSASDTARESALTASLAATGNSESVAPLSADAAAETEITTSASAMSSEPMAGATTPLDASPAVDAVSDVDSDQGMAAETAVQVEDTFPELDLSELEALDDLSELEELDLSDLSDLSESDVASELGIDPDEDPANMLDLARAYVDMGDSDAARNLLNRVSVIGTASEVTEAKKMLVSLSDD